MGVIWLIDIHTHILPALDDGAKDLNESIEMIKLELSHSVDTPHLGKDNYITSIEDIEKSYYLLQERLDKENIKVKVLLGNEINLTSNFLKILKNKTFFSLANTNYILVELNYDFIPYNLDNILYEIKLMGYNPILAHVEHYTKLYESRELLESLINEGVYLQVNATSILSRDIDKRIEFSKYLLKNKLVSFVASDAHDMIYRKPNLLECYQTVSFLYDEQYANKIFLENAKDMLNNKTIKYAKFPTKKLWRRNANE